MNVLIGDTVVHKAGGWLGIVESKIGGEYSVSRPDSGNQRERIRRDEFYLLAARLRDVCANGTKVANGFSIMGKSTISELVEQFGYSTQRLRSNSLNKVLNQLRRAGLTIHGPGADGDWQRDDLFRLEIGTAASADADDVRKEPAQKAATVSASLPDPFWPRALGLDPRFELTFLRALSGRDPLLCVLWMPDDAETSAWLQLTWEGLLSWAYRSAQRFERLHENESEPEVFISPPILLKNFFEVSVLREESLRLKTKSRCLNLVVCKKESDTPTTFDRLRTVWPGMIYEFRPEPPRNAGAEVSTDMKSLCACLLLAAGRPPEDARIDATFSPIKLLRWCKEASAQFTAAASTGLAGVFSNSERAHFRGSCESSVSLAIKTQLVGWVQQVDAHAKTRFEETIILDEESGHEDSCRVDAVVDGMGRFEIESFRGSGPAEVFYQNKVFSRISADGDPFWLVVPSESILWFGPYLADIAAGLAKGGGRPGSEGHVLIAGSAGGFLQLQGRTLTSTFESEVPWEQLNRDLISPKAQNAEPRLKLADVKLDLAIHGAVQELVIWPETIGRKFNRQSRSSGILFFGPPGCGKSRLAKAIAGELEQEARILGPSDLRGPYIGWGQLMIREQFDWLAESAGRMLIIDELDAVARSRRESGNMHSDEKADVNELLVQLDRVLGLRRVLVATTNFIASLDEAVLRSGRFGRFIPVPPPDLDEAVEIVSYYLRRLASDPEGVNGPKIRTADAKDVRTVVAAALVENQELESHFCGADLEEAVNRAYNRVAQATENSATGEVIITVDALRSSLQDVPRSIHPDTIQDFLKDVGLYCSEAVYAKLAKRLSVTREG
jgi:energy-coupling factor transporter ATP-binding protein EcfA2